MQIKRLSLMFLFLGATFCASARSPEWKSSDWQLGPGSTYLFDSYLSPLSHSGLSIRFSLGEDRPLSWGLDEETQPNHQNENWRNRLEWMLLPAYTTSTSGSQYLFVHTEIRESLFRKLAEWGDLTLWAGAYASLNGGGRYCMVNGNNPGSADIRFDLGVTAFTDYRLNIWNRDLVLKYRGSLALAGLAFSPEFTQSYYEIFYLSDYDHVLKLTSLNNKLQWMHQISADLPLSKQKSNLRVSYWNDGAVSLLNGLRIRQISNHFTLGYIRYFKTL